MKKYHLKNWALHACYRELFRLNGCDRSFDDELTYHTQDVLDYLDDSFYDGELAREDAEVIVTDGVNEYRFSLDEIEEVQP